MFGHRTVVLLVTTAASLFGSAAGGAEPNDAPPESARATDTPNVRERAKAFYEEGLKAYRAGKYSDAIDKLLEAERVMPNVAFSYNIALVYEAMGDERSALRWLRGYLRQSAAGTDQAATLGKLRKFESHLQAKGMQQVSVLSRPSGATVKIDGIAMVGITPFTAELSPGSHVATLTLDGYELVQRPFELRPDRSMDVEVPMVAQKAPLALTPAPNVTSATATPSEKPLVAVTPATQPAPTEKRVAAKVKPFTWSTLGVGSVLLGGALAFEIKRRVNESDARSAPQSEYFERYDQAESAKRTSRVLVVAGSGVALVGLGFLTYDLTRRDPVRTVTIGNCQLGGFCAGIAGHF